MTPYAVVVVLHDSEAELRALLATLGAAPRLVVVDSGSRDGGAALARAHGAEVVVLDGNPGFGAACNAGLARVREPVTVLLNPDCEVPGDALDRLAGLAHAHPGALHVPRLLNADGSVQRSAHPLPGTAGALLPALVHPPLLPRPLRVRAEPHRAETARSVGWAIAACLAAATETLRALGPFDPAVHLFAEDLDLCLRARARGIPTVLHPDLQIRHTGGHAVLRGGEAYALLARRRRAVIGERLGTRALALDDLAQAVTFATRAAGHALLGGDARRPLAQLRAVVTARRGGATQLRL